MRGRNNARFGLAGNLAALVDEHGEALAEGEIVDLASISTTAANHRSLFSSAHFHRQVRACTTGRHATKNHHAIGCNVRGPRGAFD